MFTPIRTRRLLIRPLQVGDADDLAARRSDPRVSQYQNWETPYPLERAAKIVTECIAMGGPENEEWWMANIADPISGAVYGDLAVHLSWEGRTAEVGYTLGSDHWGHGYAVEAVEALVQFLFDAAGVSRVFGMIHPENVASARVLERTGFLFEGHTRSSYWDGQEVSDDHIYGLIRPDWETWRSRTTDPPKNVRLVDIGDENWWDVYRLRTHKSQERFVADMPLSFSDVLFPEIVDGAPVVPWMRAIEADGVLAGFTMLALATSHHPEPFLWRLLIDRMHQRRSIGRRAMDLVEAASRSMGDSTLMTSWTEGQGSPRPFYVARGFEPTGRLLDGETEARKRLD